MTYTYFHLTVLRYSPFIFAPHLFYTLTLSFFSSVSGLGSRTFSFSDPSLKMSPKPIPRTFLGCAITPFPEAGAGDVGVLPVSMMFPSTGGKDWKSKRKKGGMVPIRANCKTPSHHQIRQHFFNTDILLNSNYIKISPSKLFILQYLFESAYF